MHFLTFSDESNTELASTSSNKNHEHDDSDDDNDEGEKEVYEEAEGQDVTSISSPRKSMFKSASRRLSGMPNMIIGSTMSDLKDLDDNDRIRLNEMLAKFPHPPEKIQVAPSTYSNISKSAASYLKGFWGK